MYDSFFFSLSPSLMTAEQGGDEGAVWLLKRILPPSQTKQGDSRGTFSSPGRQEESALSCKRAPQSSESHRGQRLSNLKVASGCTLRSARQSTADGKKKKEKKIHTVALKKVDFMWESCSTCVEPTRTVAKAFYCSLL